MKKPFIKLIKTRNGHYLFDVNMNELVHIESDTYDQLKCILDSPDKSLGDFISSSREIAKLAENGYLSDNRPQKIEMSETDNLDYYLDHHLHKLTLQVTQQCNFRCHYCHYTYGDDKYYHSHKNNSMTWEVAKKAIDFFAKRTRDSININIGFYGGEPLLEYKLIQKCINHCNKIFADKMLSYSITTNGALLSVDIAKYLIDNNVSILVSLDGPKEIQDKSRKFSGDGSGTFQAVFDNIEKIKHDAPEYYKKLKFHSVIDPSNDCSLVNNFFACETFKNNNVETSILQPSVGRRLYYSDEYIHNRKND